MTLETAAGERDPRSVVLEAVRRRQVSNRLLGCMLLACGIVGLASIAAGTRTLEQLGLATLFLSLVPGVVLLRSGLGRAETDPLIQAIDEAPDDIAVVCVEHPDGATGDPSVVVQLRDGGLHRFDVEPANALLVAGWLRGLGTESRAYRA